MTVDLLEPLTVGEIAEILGVSAPANADETVTSVTTDSREVRPHALFIAIKGERFDGHDFIAACAKKGMACAIASRVPEGCEGYPLLLVEDTVLSLGELASAYKTRLNPLTVGVTGSIGKTTTKEFVWAVLSEKYTAMKTEGNHNNSIGLPMTLLSMSSLNGAAVIEMGMSAPGEIDYLTRIARPNIAVITTIGTSHIEYLGSREAIRDAKMEIVNGLQPGGALVLNGDEPLLANVPGAIYVGRNPKCDVYVDNIVLGENGTAFDVTVQGVKTESLFIPALGEHSAMDAAFAFTVGLLAGMGEFEIRRGLRNFKQTGLRQKIYEKAGRTILEDCYNAAPESDLAALKVLSNSAAARRLRPVAVLGDIRELGSFSEEGHRTVGRAAAAAGLGLLVTVGGDARIIAEEAEKNGLSPDRIHRFEAGADPETVARWLTDHTDGGDIILFKASRAVALEKVIEKMN